MGFFDLFKSKPTTPIVSSILPLAASNEIENGRLPILNTDTIFLRKDEKCHFIDKAIFEKKSVKKRYVRRSNGYSMPGLFKGDRIHLGGGHTDVEDNIQSESLKGILYITNKRVIFVGESKGFDKSINDIIAITPYSNCIELQCGKENFTIFVPSGELVKKVLHLIK